MASPPSFSSRASASTSANIASTITGAAPMAVTSERSQAVAPVSPLARSTEGKPRRSVEIGLKKPRTTRSEPLVTPPSSPPARLLTRSRWPSTCLYGSCASDPRTEATSMPSPMVAAFTEGIATSAWTILPSSLRSQWTYEPRPGGRPRTTAPTTPPMVSPFSRAARTASTSRSSSSGFGVTRGEEKSTTARSSQVGEPDKTSSGPTRRTADRMAMP